jgi:LysR family transcriptional activator of nhaA
MQWLNYHHLLYFWVVAKEGGLGPAGKQLRLSSPTLSGQIRKLEDALDVKLFQRRGRRLELTDVGRVAYRYAEEIFGLGRELRDVLEGRPADRPLRLVVGIADVVPKLLLRKLLAPALDAPQPVRLICREDRFDRLLADLAAHELDVVIADSPVPPGAAVRAYHHALGHSGVMIVGEPALARSVRRGLPGSLEGAPLLLPLEGSSLRRQIDDWLRGLGVTPKIVVEAEDSELLNVFAADGMGLVFVPAVIADVVCKRYGLARVGRAGRIKERYYAISVERRLIHPAVLAIRDAARGNVFA